MAEENKQLKSRIGKLGMYLIDQARNKIKDLNQQILFRKGEIKKKYRELEEKKSKNLRNEFIVDYNHILNTNLSSTLLDSKEKVLTFKNRIISNFINDLYAELENRIKNNYSDYQSYIIKQIEEIKSEVDNPHEIIIYFNSRDFKFFKNSVNKIENIIGRGFKIEEDPKIEIGGFKLENAKQKILFNYTLESVIQKNYSMIETKFTSIIADSKIKDLQTEFEEFINQKKKDREEILVEYDRI
jgi:vacuolar-type H+-ATPase subunit E/Vma4